jgi:hypothetical protein
MPANSGTQIPIDRSKTYLCRFSCGFETNWPAALGRHEAARHNGHGSLHATPLASPRKDSGNPAGKSRPLPASVKMDRLIDELRKQHEEKLQTLKKASLLVLAERDLRTRETEQIRADLDTLYNVLEVLERNRQARHQRLNALVR